MKNLILTILLALFAIQAQSQTDHMKFKGIPMGGSLQSFTKQLQSKGYTLLYNADGASILKGDFAGYSGCEIYVFSDNKIVHHVNVRFTMDRWEYLYGCYTDLKGMLTEKYGSPLQSEEYFENCYDGDDFLKMQGVKLDGCKYYSYFNCEQGYIALKITHVFSDSCDVILTYFDAEGIDRSRSSAMDDL